MVLVKHDEMQADLNPFEDEADADDEGEGSSDRKERASWLQLVSLEVLLPAGALRFRVPNAAKSSWRVSQTDVCEET